MAIRKREEQGQYGLAKLWERRDKLNRLSPWGARWQLFLQAYRGIRTSPFTSALTVATITATLVLLGFSILCLRNFGDVVGQTSQALRMSVYLKEESSLEQRDALGKLLEKSEGVVRVEFRSKEQALEEFSKSLGTHSTLLEGLGGQNPLPASFEVTMSDDATDVEALKAVENEIQRQPGVDEVQFNQVTLVELGKLLRMMKTLSFVAIVALLLITGFIISNTIKLGLYVYRTEIEIMRLVGATPAYVRIPFLFEGALKGLVGALVGIGVVYAIYAVIAHSMGSSALFAMLLPNFHFPLLLISISLILVGMAVGIAGSFLAARDEFEE